MNDENSIDYLELTYQRFIQWVDTQGLREHLTEEGLSSLYGMIREALHCDSVDDLEQISEHISRDIREYSNYDDALRDPWLTGESGEDILSRIDNEDDIDWCFRDIGAAYDITPTTRRVVVIRNWYNPRFPDYVPRISVIEGRRAKCKNCGTITRSTTVLIDFEYLPGEEFDRYLCKSCDERLFYSTEPTSQSADDTGPAVLSDDDIAEFFE